MPMQRLSFQSLNTGRGQETAPIRFRPRDGTRKVHESIK